MSPRGPSSNASSSSGVGTRSSSSPYSRRSGGQPKSTRQQFSACGACRMRRVRCDLKDLTITSAEPNPSCSNCKERGIKCVDEFADVKAVKLLRRGRRLQQVEAIYGKTADGQNNVTSPPTTRLPSIIPNLRPEFFNSSFWLWFSIHRPIIDPIEFPSRFCAHIKGTQSLGHEGGLIAMLLVVWAASFGLDERGLPVDEKKDTNLSVDANDDLSLSDGKKLRPSSPIIKSCEGKLKMQAMLREVLELVDFHGVMRRPTLDGVRVLLLMLPLLEDVQPLERAAIHGAALSQVLALCTSSHASTSHDTKEISIRARIFWYAYTHEGILTGMKGGRFVLTNEDFDEFQKLLPPTDPAYNCTGLTAQQLFHSQYQDRSPSSAAKGLEELTQLSRVPLRLSNACRRLHGVLMGPKAKKSIEEHGLIEANAMQEIWREIDRCWQELDFTTKAFPQVGDLTRHTYIRLYASGWQIFIFECLNLIRESLKQSMSTTPTQQLYATSPPRPSSSSSSSSPFLSSQQLHETAHKKCVDYLPYVVRIIKQHLNTDFRDLTLFKWDTGLVRDGCFFAGYLSATLDLDTLQMVIDGTSVKEEGVDSLPVELTVDDNVSTCSIALSRSQWAFAKSHERKETIEMLWDTHRDGCRHQTHRSDSDIRYRPSVLYGHNLESFDLHGAPHSSLHHERPSLPPLTVFGTQRRVESAPSTSYTPDGSGANGWPCYTPPGTSTSASTSTSTGLSMRSSPVFPNPGTYKQDDDSFYNGTTSEIEHFSFNVPLVGSVVRDTPVYSHRNLPTEVHAVTSGSSAYLGQAFVTFNGDCNGAYH